MSKPMVKMMQLYAAIETEAPEYDPFIILGMAWIETGCFEHIIGWNNFWGIKYPRSEKRRAMIDRIVKRGKTKEHFGEKQKDRKDRFVQRAKEEGTFIKEQYDIRRRIWIVTIVGRFCDWSREGLGVRYLKQLVSDLYKPALKHTSGPPEKFYKGLISGPYKYATVQEHGKYIYDKLCMGGYRTARRAFKEEDG